MATIICPNKIPQMATVGCEILKIAERIMGYKREVVKMSVDPRNLQDRTRVNGSLMCKAVVSITEGEIIVSGGRGLGGSEGFQLLEQLAELLAGAVGAS